MIVVIIIIEYVPAYVEFGECIIVLRIRMYLFSHQRMEEILGFRLR